ncbi:VOC family protein [Streptomyces sp. GC420]|uniref:VOC family protein n=1 Tax=Streptomyces sp. GC420 TaxID=2697568 RepID=UPI00141515A5|nr:VOC family protein [Streptomyces sp. GC420]NBM17387.1 VOC family protein [Streptomyces sp. GC420]
MTERTADSVIPARYHRAVVPHIMVDDAAAAIDFYRRAFGAREEFRLEAPAGGILHAEISIGASASGSGSGAESGPGSVLMLGDSAGTDETYAAFAAPASLGGRTTVTLHVFVPDVDGLAERAEAAGAEVVEPPTDTFHGNRTVILKDPFGHIWVFLTHLEDLSEEELGRRFADAG